MPVSNNRCQLLTAQQLVRLEINVDCEDHMAKEKYTIFISSTYDDLRDEREQAIKAVLEMGHIPVGMEMFSAGDEQQWELIKRTIEECDYYVLILAHRYGSLDGSIGYTEKEYDYATMKRVPTLGFVIDDSAKWPKNRMDTDPSNISALTAFKVKVKSKIVNFWQNKDDLHSKITVALSKAITAYPRSGWIKAENAISPHALSELTRLSKENADLRKTIAESEINSITEKAENEIRVINILKSNKASVGFYYSGDKDWSNNTNFTYSDIFFLLAPELMVEKSIKEISYFIGTMWHPDTSTPKKELRSTWPTPSNTIKNIFADFHALGIACPSHKKHSVHDKEEYWCITELGKAIYTRIRMSKLESGLAKPETQK